MGIKNLHQLLRKHCPDVYVEQPLEAYRYKKLAIDASLYMFKYKTSAGDRWLSCFVSLLAALRRHEIHPVFCFDNGAPPEKQQERANRQESREKIRAKTQELEQALREFDNDQTIAPCLMELMEKSRASVEKKLLLRSNVSAIFDRKIAEREIKKLQNQSIHIYPEDFALLRELCTIMNVPIVEAPGEAEKKCVELCTGDSVYGVVTEDTDVLAYGTTVFISNIKYHESKCTEIALIDILEGLDLTYDAFRDLCIMCGTDYNKNIPKIGPEKAYQLIKQYGSIDMIGANTAHNIDILNHERSRELLTAIPDQTPIPFCKVPDFQNLDIFLFKNNSKVSIDGLKKSFTQHELSFD
jgi:5'-3' exonuclease